jgi:flagellar basal body rod protein FlgG
MPIRGIVNTAHTLAYYERRQEVAANNIANANTDAFKADRMTARLVQNGAYPVPVASTDLQQGALRTTGRSLDVALEGPGFLVVQTPQGDRLTRGGSLRIDGASRLTDTHGNPVLGDRGPIVVDGTDLVVHDDGSLVVDGALVAKLEVMNVSDPKTLRKEGAGLFATDAPLQPVDEGVTMLRQGSIEDPNLDGVLSMVDLVTIQRAYTANLDALRAMDGVLGIVTGEVGKV